MPTQLRSFPEVSRQGHLETQWSAAIPANIRYLQVVGVASDAVLSDPANAVTLTVYVSPDGTDQNQQIVNIEPWVGGTHVNHSGQTVPNVLDVTFGPLTQFVGWRCKLAADINNAANNNSGAAMVVGGSVTSLP